MSQEGLTGVPRQNAFDLLRAGARSLQQGSPAAGSKGKSKSKSTGGKAASHSTQGKGRPGVSSLASASRSAFVATAPTPSSVTSREAPGAAHADQPRDADDEEQLGTPPAASLAPHGVEYTAQNSQRQSSRADSVEDAHDVAALTAAARHTPGGTRAPGTGTSDHNDPSTPPSSAAARRPGAEAAAEGADGGAAKAEATVGSAAEEPGAAGAAAREGGAAAGEAGEAAGAEAEGDEPPAKRARLPAPFRPPTAKTFSRQVHDFFLVLDLEATCTKRRDLMPVEIIEISAVLLHGYTQRSAGDFQCYVRPTEHPRLDPFCVELTGITQEQVDAAPPLAEALSRLHTWLLGLGALAEGASMLPVTWTDWDLKICLETECGWRKLPRPPYLRRWCNLKRLYTARYRRTASLQKCVEAVGLRWEGRLHSGLDDARNTAALAVRMVRDGVVLRTTDSFKEAPTAGAPGGPAGPAGPGSGVKEAAGPGGPAGPTGPEAAGPAGSGSAAAAPSPFGAGSPGSAPREGAEADVGAGAGAGAGSQTCVERSAGGEAGPSPSGRARAAGAGGGGGGGGLRQAVITLTPASSPGLAAPSGAGPSGSASPSQASPSGGGGGGGGGGMTAVAVGSAPPALYDGEGRWLGRCRCGVPANLRTAKKPGANQGRQFYSCGRWSISDRARAVCGFFAWAEGLRLAPGAVTPGGGAGGRGGKRKQ